MPHHGLQPARFLCPWNFPGKNSGVGCHFLLQGIFPSRTLTHGSCCSPLQAGSLLLSHGGSPINKSDIFYNRRDKNAISFVIENSLTMSLGDSLTLNESKNPEEYVVCLICFICLYIHDSVYFCIF